MTYSARVSGILIVIVASSYTPGAVPTALVAAGAQLTDTVPAGHFRSFRIPTSNSEPRDITLGSDGHMWFTESNIDVSQIARIDARGNITEFVVPTRFSQPSDIVSGPDGALWFTAPSGFPDFFIGRVTTAGLFTDLLPTATPSSGAASFHKALPAALTATSGSRSGCETRL